MNGVKPCIVSFANWKDKENVLRQAKLLKGCGIYITGQPIISKHLKSQNDTGFRFSEDVSSKAGPGARGKLRRASSVSAVTGLDKVK